MILESEGEKQMEINSAEADKQRIILESEAEKIALINRAQGDAEAVFAKAEAHSKGLEMISQAMQRNPMSQEVSAAH
jgi:regulator of protease activity HflC (stomatin/prohibitin superfamily)